MRISILVALVMSVAAGARAQNREPHLFVDGALLGDRDPKYPFESSMALGGSGAIGLRISKHFSVRFEAEVPAMHTETFRGGYTFFATETETFRTTTYSGLLAGHYQAHKKVNVAFLAGLSAARHEGQGSDFLETPGPNGAVVHHWLVSYRTGALTTGLDAAVSLTPHLAIVPGVRFHTDLNSFASTRPKVALRWTF
jgi:hypothetical protein